MLHNSHTIIAPEHGGRTCWAGWNRENRDYERLGKSSWNYGVRVQLLGANGLQIMRKYLQGFGADWRLGVF